MLLAISIASLTVSAAHQQEHGSEELDASDLHIPGDVAEESGFEICASWVFRMVVLMTTMMKDRTLNDCVFDYRLDIAESPRGDHCAHIRRRGVREHIS